MSLSRELPPSARRSRAISVGLGMWAAALITAVTAQSRVHLVNEPRQAAWLYLAAALLAAIAILCFDRFLPADRSSSPEAANGGYPAPRSRRVAWVLTAGGIGCVLSTVGLVRARELAALAALLWAGGLALTCIGVAAGFPGRAQPATRSSRFPFAESLAVVAILALATTLRLADLASIPPEVHGDEAAVGIDARKFLAGPNSNLFTTGWATVPNVSYALPAITMAAFGADLFGLRMHSALLGLGSVLLTYLVARRLFGVRVGLLTAGLLAISAWHIHFSRTGFHYMQALFAVTLVLAFFLRGIEEGRSLDFLLAGYAVGLSLTVYYAGRVAFLIIALYLAYRALRERDFLRRQWRGALVLIAGLVLFLIPWAPDFVRNPNDFMARTNSVWLFTPDVLRHMMNSTNSQTVPEVVVAQFRNTLIAFNYSGESSMQYGRRAPLLDFWSAPLLVLGTVVILLRITQPQYLLIAGLGLATIGAAALTVDAPFAPRMVVILPVLMVAVALAVDAGWRPARELGRIGQAVVAGLVAAFFASATMANVNDYFVVHVRQARPAGPHTVIARFVADHNPQYRSLVIDEGGWFLDYDTTNFLAPDRDAQEFRNSLPPVPLPPAMAPTGKGVIFVIQTHHSRHDEYLAQLRRTYPGGEERKLGNAAGQMYFTAYLVSLDQLLSPA